MFKLSNAELETKKAIFTVREIESQPILWKETLAIYENHQKQIDAFLDNIHKKTWASKGYLHWCRDISACGGCTISIFFSQRR